MPAVEGNEEPNKDFWGSLVVTDFDPKVSDSSTGFAEVGELKPKEKVDSLGFPNENAGVELFVLSCLRSGLAGDAVAPKVEFLLGAIGFANSNSGFELFSVFAGFADESRLNSELDALPPKVDVLLEAGDAKLNVCFAVSAGGLAGLSSEIAEKTGPAVPLLFFRCRSSSSRVSR